MLATVLPVAVFMLILYRLWSVYYLYTNLDRGVSLLKPFIVLLLTCLIVPDQTA